jgi:plasmid stability protein
VERCSPSPTALSARSTAVASLSVRKIDDEVYERLTARAVEHGVSMGEEARQILRRAVAAPERLGQLALRCFGPAHGFVLELALRSHSEECGLEIFNPFEAGE